MQRGVTGLFQSACRIACRTLEFVCRYRSASWFMTLIFVASATFYVSPILQEALASLYATDREIQALRDLILSIGTALVGATAIVTSLVLFAMQVNIERMPHGLFRRINGDPKLIFTFGFAFLSAIIIAILSVTVNPSRIACVVLTAFWSIVSILSSFVYAYRRALLLVNPSRQLEILLRATTRELRRWARRSQRQSTRPRREGSLLGAMPLPFDSRHDLTRIEFFRINSHWTDGTERALLHSMAFVRHYTVQGDYEVSSQALNTVVAINVAYIKSKGSTFFAIDQVFDNPLSSDKVINETLEQLRQNAQSGIARRDERQIEQTLHTIADLVQVYLSIDYSSRYADKTHAQLAAGYLVRAVQAVVPHEMADVLLEGQRLMGQCVEQMLTHGESGISPLSEGIAVIACTGLGREEYRPVTMEGMTQFSSLTFTLLRSKVSTIHSAVSIVRRDMALVANRLLDVPDSRLLMIHSMGLGAYYSSTTTSSLRIRLERLADAISAAKEDDTDAQLLIQNIERWTDGHHHIERELLIKSISVGSPFTFDLAHWITGVTIILLRVSNAAACIRSMREKLRSQARRLISTLNWIPSDEKAVEFVESFQLTDLLFGAAMDARSHGCVDIADAIGGSLLSWAFKGGSLLTNRGVLERGLCGCAVIALSGRCADVKALMGNIESRVQAECGPAKSVLEGAATGIRERAESLPLRGSRASRIDQAILQADYRSLAPLLNEIAAVLSSTDG